MAELCVMRYLSSLTRGPGMELQRKFRVLTTGRPGKSPPQCHFMLLLLCSLNSHQRHETDEQWTQGNWWFLKAKQKKVVVAESFISMDASRNLQLEDVRALNAWPGIVSAALCGWFLVPHRHWWLWGLWKSCSWYWGGGWHPGPLCPYPPKHPPDIHPSARTCFPLLRLSSPSVERHLHSFSACGLTLRLRASHTQSFSCSICWLGDAPLRGFPFLSCSYFIHSPDKLLTLKFLSQVCLLGYPKLWDLWSQRSEPSLIFSDFLYASAAFGI